MRLLPALLLAAVVLIAPPSARAATPADSCAHVIPAVTIPAVVALPVVVPDQDLAGHRVPGFAIGGVDIPELTLPAQCIEIGEAPVGCLGEINVPGRVLPGIELPSVTIPAISVPGFNHAEVVINGDTSDPDVRPGEVIPAVCAPARGHFITQQTSRQPQLFRWFAYRPSITRSPVCLGRSCLPAIDGPSLSVDSVVVPEVPSLARRLEATVPITFKTRCTRVYTGHGDEAHVLCPRELFRPRSTTIRASAARVLRATATVLRRHRPHGTIRIDAHVHGAGSPQANLRASKRQAAAVRRWLVRHTSVSPTRVVAHGYGDAWPAERQTSYSSSSRVVISVARR